MDINECVKLFLSYMNYSVPFAVVFGFGTKLVNMVLNAAIGGRIDF